MMIHGMIIHHKNNVYRISLPDQYKTPVCDMVFPHDGDTFEVERVVRIMVKHMKAIWKVQ